MEATGLGPGSKVLTQSQWFSSVDPRRRAGRFVTGVSDPYCLVLDGAQQRVEIPLDLPGTAVGEKVWVKTRITLLESVDPGELAASRPGSTLWEDEKEKEVELEGRGARVSVCQVDFGNFPSRFPYADALWAVLFTGTVDESLRSDVSAGMMVYLNKRREHELVTHGESPEATAIRTMLYWDVGRQMFRHALSSQDYLEGTELYGSGSLGESISAKLRLVFPNMERTEIHQMMEEEPSRFEQALQSRLNLLEEG